MKPAFRGHGDHFLVVAAILSVCAVLALAVAYRQSRRPDPPRLAGGACVLAVGSALSIATLTLTRHGEPAVHAAAQLRPLATLRLYVQLQNPWLTVVYVLGNVAMFVPLGFFLFLALRRFGRPTIAVTVLTGALLSLTVESMQSRIWSRNTDVDDFILNTLGGLIGTLLGVAAWQASRYARRLAEAQVPAGLTSGRPLVEDGPAESDSSPVRHPA